MVLNTSSDFYAYELGTREDLGAIEVYIFIQCHIPYISAHQHRIQYMANYNTDLFCINHGGGGEFVTIVHLVTSF